MDSLILNFDDENSGFLLKFGKRQHLEDIKNGYLRFSSLKYYREIELNDNEASKAIRDIDEGLSCNQQNNEGSKFEFQSAKQGNNSYDVTSSITGFKDYPNWQKYISCFTYITKNDVINKTVISKEILKNPAWDSVLFILDSKNFKNNLKNACKNYKLHYKKVTYFDFSKKILNADEFSKSDKYKYQKEYRFSIDFTSLGIDLIKSIPHLIVQYEKVCSVIISTTEFADCFSVEKL